MAIGVVSDLPRRADSKVTWHWIDRRGAPSSKEPAQVIGVQEPRGKKVVIRSPFRGTSIMNRRANRRFGGFSSPGCGKFEQIMRGTNQTPFGGDLILSP